LIQFTSGSTDVPLITEFYQPVTQNSDECFLPPCKTIAVISRELLGANFSLVITHPTILGGLPQSLQANATTASTKTLNYEHFIILFSSYLMLYN